MSGVKQARLIREEPANISTISTSEATSVILLDLEMHKIASPHVPRIARAETVHTDDPVPALASNLREGMNR